MNWIDAILSRIFYLWPFIRIQKWAKGVRSSFIPFKGAVISVLEPGFHRCLPWFETVVFVVVVPQVYNLPTQSITCKDGTAATLSCNFTFEVENAEAACNEVYDLPDSIQGLAMMHIASKLRGWTWDELQEHQKDLERSLKETLTTKTKRWGVTIIDVGLTDLVKARSFRLFGDPLAAHG